MSSQTDATADNHHNKGWLFGETVFPFHAHRRRPIAPSHNICLCFVDNTRENEARGSQRDFVCLHAANSEHVIRSFLIKVVHATLKKIAYKFLNYVKR